MSGQILFDVGRAVLIRTQFSPGAGSWPDQPYSALLKFAIRIGFL
jgi:hypothetical protein